MARDLENEIDELRCELLAIKDILISYSSTNPMNSNQGNKQQVSDEDAIVKFDEQCDMLLKQLEDRCITTENDGSIIHIGTYGFGKQRVKWIKYDESIRQMIQDINSSTITDRLLTCLGGIERLQLLLAIMNKPKSVAELVQCCGFSSTGQVYHYLKSLIATGIITESREIRGAYTACPQYIRGILLVLAGLNEIVISYKETNERYPTNINKPTIPKSSNGCSPIKKGGT